MSLISFNRTLVKYPSIFNIITVEKICEEPEVDVEKPPNFLGLLIVKQKLADFGTLLSAIIKRAYCKSDFYTTMSEEVYATMVEQIFTDKFVWFNEKLYRLDMEPPQQKVIFGDKSYVLSEHES